MTTQNQPQTQGSRAVTYEVNGEEVKLSPQIIRDYLVRGNGEVSNQEVTMFLQLCRFQKLNPFLNEAYLVKFGTQPASIITSKEAFMKRAETHKQYEGIEAGIVVARNEEIIDLEGAIKLPNDQLIGGWAKVYREDRKWPINVRISYEEFSKGQATWKQMPLNMIRKVAVVNALREAFPETLGSLYTEDEEKPASSPKQVFDTQETIDNNANQQALDINTAQEMPKEKVEAPEPEPVENDIEENPFDNAPQQESMDGPGF